MQRKITFKTKYFWYEAELSGDEDAYALLNEVKEMIEVAESIDFPSEETRTVSNSTKESAPFNIDPPSEKQIELMNKFGVKYDDMTTKAQARELIGQAIKNK